MRRMIKNRMTKVGKEEGRHATNLKSYHHGYPHEITKRNVIPFKEKCVTLLYIIHTKLA